MPVTTTEKKLFMSKIIFKYVDGTTNEAEVDGDLAEWYAEIERRESLVNRKETRRHQSLDKSLEHGWDILDTKINVQTETERNEMIAQLYISISKLQKQQRELIRRVYFCEEKMSDIAKEEGVDGSSIRHRLGRALKILKKILD